VGERVECGEAPSHWNARELPPRHSSSQSWRQDQIQARPRDRHQLAHSGVKCAVGAPSLVSIRASSR
jgi:hypothetical protein